MTSIQMVDQLWKGMVPLLKWLGFYKSSPTQPWINQGVALMLVLGKHKADEKDSTRFHK